MGLDTLILRQFEKLNQKVYQKWGWNKYDLSQTASTIAFSSILLFGGDRYLLGAIDGDAKKIIGGTLLSIVGTFGLVFFRGGDRILEQQEYKKSLNAEETNYSGNFLRPFWLGAGIFLLYQCGKTLGHEYSIVPKFFGTAGSSLTAHMISSYCRELSFNPSQKQK